MGAVMGWGLSPSCTDATKISAYDDGLNILRIINPDLLISSEMNWKKKFQNSML